MRCLPAPWSARGNDPRHRGGAGVSERDKVAVRGISDVIFVFWLSVLTLAGASTAQRGGGTLPGVLQNVNKLRLTTQIFSSSLDMNALFNDSQQEIII